MPFQGQTGPSGGLSGTSKDPQMVCLRAGAYLVNAKPAVGPTVVSLPTRRRRSGRGESSDVKGPACLATSSDDSKLYMIRVVLVKGF